MLMSECEDAAQEAERERHLSLALLGGDGARERLRELLLDARARVRAAREVLVDRAHRAARLTQLAHAVRHQRLLARLERARARAQRLRLHAAHTRSYTRATRNTNNYININKCH